MCNAFGERRAGERVEMLWGLSWLAGGASSLVEDRVIVGFRPNRR